VSSERSTSASRIELSSHGVGVAAIATAPHDPLVADAPSNDRSPSLLAWQWSGYPTFHADRTNLVIHVLTQPMFVLGLLSVIASPVAGSIVGVAVRAVSGLALMAVAIIAQGRGHAREGSPPIPFAGPADAVKRIFGEQLINFPRFVLSGGIARAWKASQR
jgi:hypothetical protein